MISLSWKLCLLRTTSYATIHQIENELGLSDHNVADWGMFCRETMLELLQGSSKKIGSPNKTVEIDEGKIGRRTGMVPHNTDHLQVRVSGYFFF